MSSTTTSLGEGTGSNPSSISGGDSDTPYTTDNDDGTNNNNDITTPNTNTNTTGANETTPTVSASSLPPSSSSAIPPMASPSSVPSVSGSSSVDTLPFVNIRQTSTSTSTPTNTNTSGAQTQAPPRSPVTPSTNTYSTSLRPTEILTSSAIFKRLPPPVTPSSASHKKLVKTAASSVLPPSPTPSPKQSAGQFLSVTSNTSSNTSSNTNNNINSRVLIPPTLLHQPQMMTTTTGSSGAVPTTRTPASKKTMTSMAHRRGNSHASVLFSSSSTSTTPIIDNNNSMSSFPMAPNLKQLPSDYSSSSFSTNDNTTTTNNNTTSSSTTSSSTKKVFVLDDLPLPSPPRPPAKCPLFCCFYAVFDNKVGPMIGCQSPKNFMNHDITISTDKIHGMLAKTFQKYNNNNNVKSNTTTSKSTTTGSKPTKPTTTTTTTSSDTPTTTTTATTKNNKNGVPATTTGDVSSSTGTTGDTPTSTVTPLHQDSTQPLDNEQGKEDEKNDNDDEEEKEEVVILPEGSFSIFDSTSEYIITGHELSDKVINLSTHGMHILTRPTVIHDNRYARNALLFSVGFVLRRAADPRPFQPLLSKWAVTLRSMEVESHVLSKPQNSNYLETVLERLLISLNSPSWECNLLLSPSNALNLKLFQPPRPVATPVQDWEVPILLRRDLHLQMFDWDLAINWVILHIDGVANARLISIKAEVDMEMVRACLRVLKHHGVIAMVDMFLYTNRYEFTPRASAMLAGQEPRLLQEAVDFSIKASRLSTASFQVPHDMSQHSGGGGSAGGGNNNSPVGGIFGGRNAGGYVGGSERSESDSSHPANASSSYIHQHHPLGTSPYGSSMMSTSYPPKNSMGFAGSHRGTSYKFTMLAGTSLERDPYAAMPPRSKEESRNLKSVMAELYCACNRNLSFGDLWITLTAPFDGILTDNSRHSSNYNHNNNINNTSGDETSPLTLPNLRQPPPRTNTSTTGTSSTGASYSTQQGVKRPNIRSNKISFSDIGPDQQPPVVDPLESLVLSPLETTHLETLRARANGGGPVGTVVDWTDAFNLFDHRRFASFGVVHNLLVRVHCYPYFPGIFPDPPPIMMSNATSKRATTNHPPPTSAASAEQENINNATANANTQAEYSSTKQGGTKEKERESYELARKVASLMDGTRCDDELVCNFEKPFQQLVELVETYGGMKIVTVYARAPDFVDPTLV